MTESEIRYHISELRNKAKLLDDNGLAVTGISKQFRVSADIIEELLENRTRKAVE